MNLSNNSIITKGAISLAKSNAKKSFLGANHINYNDQTHQLHLKMINDFTFNNTILELYLNFSFIPNEMIAQLIRNNTNIKVLS